MIDVVLDIPPFTVRLRSTFATVKRHVEVFYADARRPDTHGAFIDFDIQVLPGRGLRRWWQPQARFLLDDIQPFYPLPATQAAPSFEWGLNWCVAQRPLGWSVIHAAVVAWDGQAVVMPGHPGAGKSTLCSSLVMLDGGRLLSDELAILDAQAQLIPHPRPIALKNRSIDIVRAFPGSQIGPVYPDTRKGALSHAACPPASRQAASEPATAAWIVFPRFDPEAPPGVEEISRVEAFAAISEQSFNKESMGEAGFDAVCRMLTGARCFEIQYRSTEEGLDLMRRVRNA